MRKKLLNIIIIIILTILVLYFALKDNYKEIMTVLFNAKIGWLIFVFLLVLGYTFLKTIVTNNIINSFKKYTFLDTFKLQFMTFFFNAITPFSSGGQPFQIYVLKKDKLTLTQATNSVVQESIVHQLSFTIIVTIAILLNMILNIYELDFTLKLFLLIAYILNIFVTFILFLIAYGKKADSVIGKLVITFLSKLRIFKDKNEKIEKWNQTVKNFNVASKNLLSNKLRFIKLLVLNIFAIVSLYMTPLVILYSLGNLTAFNGTISFILVSFVSLISCYLPLPGGSLGQEYLFTVFFSKYIGNPILSSTMILWRFMTYYAPMIIGAIAFNINKKK